jgi:putative transposase
VVGYPKTIRVDQGSEFISRDLDPGLRQRCDTGLPAASPPTTRTSKPSMGASGGVSEHPLVPHACRCPRKLEEWRRYYNEDRPHGAIGNKPPITLINPGDAPSPSP